MGTVTFSLYNEPHRNSNRHMGTTLKEVNDDRIVKAQIVLTVLVVVLVACKFTQCQFLA